MHLRKILHEVAEVVQVHSEMKDREEEEDNLRSLGTKTPWMVKQERTIPQRS